MLGIVWIGALAAIVFKFAWVDAPTWISSVIGVALGWVAVIVVPQLIDEVEIGGSTLVFIGGLLYTAGALVYAFGAPTRIRPSSGSTRSSTCS